jgi:hypothetical protein
MMNRWLPTLLAATLGLGACDAMTDDNYLGEAQFSLRGTVQNRRTSTPENVKLYLLWQRNGDVPNIGVELNVEPKFPARFQLDVFERPAAVEPLVQALSHAPESWGPPSALGDFIAAEPGTDLRWHNPADLTWHPQPGIVGIDPRHWLYYFEDDVGADTLPGLVFHGAQTKGFHLFERKCVSPARAAQIAECLTQFPPFPWKTEDILPAALKACGSTHPTWPWLQRAPDDLNTELTVELMDDPASWKPDPSECI